jgi:hypothetical protein
MIRSQSRSCQLLALGSINAVAPIEMPAALLARAGEVIE